MVGKTSKSVAKRFKVTKKNKIMYYAGRHSHLLSKKSAKCKRPKGKPRFLKSKKLRKTIRRLLHG
jgi:large subunit ribosomal protein L35